MVNTRWIVPTLVFTGFVSSAVSSPAVGQATRSFPGVEEALGRKGAAQPGDVLKFSFPRSELSVTADGVPINPAVTGDFVRRTSELNKVIRALQTHGITPTALLAHAERGAAPLLHALLGERRRGDAGEGLPGDVERDGIEVGSQTRGS
jgi:hypothetical protein